MTSMWIFTGCKVTLSTLISHCWHGKLLLTRKDAFNSHLLYITKKFFHVNVSWSHEESNCRLWKWREVPPREDLLSQAKGLLRGIPGMLRPEFLNVAFPLERSPRYETSILVFNKLKNLDRFTFLLDQYETGVTTCYSPSNSNSRYGTQLMSFQKKTA